MNGQKVLAWIRGQGLLLGLGAAIVLAALFPILGTEEGPLPVEALKKAGIFFVFLSMGLTLPAEEIIAGLGRWRQHGIIQAWIFGAMPLLAWMLVLPFRDFLPSPLLDGFLFLAILPTTVSSALVLTSTSGGNVTLAIFNTTFANLAAVFATPLLAALLLDARGSDAISLGETLGRLSVLILVPFAMGAILRPMLKPVLPRVKPWFRPINNTTICYIVFLAFAQSFHERVWQEHGAVLALEAGAGVVVFLGIASALAWWLGKAAAQEPPDRSAIFYCASQKSLATGIPIGGSLFGGLPEFSLLILPLMLYHPLQLVLGAAMQSRWNKVARSEE